MARKTREKVIEELTKMGVDFDARESYVNLCELLKIETRNRQSAPTQETETTEESPAQETSEAQPLSLSLIHI